MVRFRSSAVCPSHTSEKVTSSAGTAFQASNLSPAEMFRAPVCTATADPAWNVTADASNSESKPETSISGTRCEASPSCTGGCVVRVPLLTFDGRFGAYFS